MLLKSLRQQVTDSGCEHRLLLSKSVHWLLCYYSLVKKLNMTVFTGTISSVENSSDEICSHWGLWIIRSNQNISFIKNIKTQLFFSFWPLQTKFNRSALLECKSKWQISLLWSDRKFTCCQRRLSGHYIYIYISTVVFLSSATLYSTISQRQFLLFTIWQLCLLVTLLNH